MCLPSDRATTQGCPYNERHMDRLTSDVLVVGAGLAGFTAAARASEQGAKVVLIDKSGG